jgi:hypothetical protein
MGRLDRLHDPQPPKGDPRRRPPAIGHAARAPWQTDRQISPPQDYSAKGETRLKPFFEGHQLMTPPINSLSEELKGVLAAFVFHKIPRVVLSQLCTKGICLQQVIPLFLNEVPED